MRECSSEWRTPRYCTIRMHWWLESLGAGRRVWALWRKERQMGDVDRGDRLRCQGVLRATGVGAELRHSPRSDIFGPRWVRRRGDSFVEPFVSGQTAVILDRAFAGDRGIQIVEFSADDRETWRGTRIDYSGTNLTWTFWSAEWLPEEPGEYTLVSRATDGTGTPQLSESRGIVPQGATGYHRVVATVV